MPRVEIADFQNAKVYTMLDAGVYTVAINEEPAVGQTSNGNPRIEVTMEVADGPTQQSGENPAGRIVKDFIPLKLASKIKALLLAAGLLQRDDTTSEIATGSFDTSILYGTRFQVRLSHRMYEGKPQLDVNYVV